MKEAEIEDRKYKKHKKTHLLLLRQTCSGNSKFTIIVKFSPTKKVELSLTFFLKCNPSDTTKQC